MPGLLGRLRLLPQAVQQLPAAGLGMTSLGAQKGHELASGINSLFLFQVVFL